MKNVDPKYITYSKGCTENKGSASISKRYIGSKRNTYFVRRRPWLFFIMCAIIIAILVPMRFWISSYSAIISIGRNFATTMKLEQIIVHGNSRLSQEDVIQRATSGALIDSSAFNTSVENIRKKVEQEPYIAEADVRILLPNRIIIHIKEKQPSAIWHNGDQLCLIDSNGSIIKNDVTELEKAQYIVIFGNDANTNFHEVTNAMRSSTFYNKIASLQFVNTRYWNVFLSDGMIIKLPMHRQDITKAISTLDAILRSSKHKSSLRQLLQQYNVIDLRLIQNNRAYLSSSLVFLSPPS